MTKACQISFGLDLEEKTLIPKSRTAVRVRFTAVHLTGALLILRDANHKTLPAGTDGELSKIEFAAKINKQSVSQWIRDAIRNNWKN